MKHLPATGPQDYLHAGNWLTSFYLAVICRENERVSQLAQVPMAQAVLDRERGTFPERRRPRSPWSTRHRLHGYDADMPIEIESKYIPRALLKRSWVGEFDT